MRLLFMRSVLVLLMLHSSEAYNEAAEEEVCAQTSLLQTSLMLGMSQKSFTAPDDTTADAATNATKAAPLAADAATNATKAAPPAAVAATNATKAAPPAKDALPSRPPREQEKPVEIVTEAPSPYSPAAKPGGVPMIKPLPPSPAPPPAPPSPALTPQEKQRKQAALDCETTSWSDWSECASQFALATPSTGYSAPQRMRTRTILTPKSEGGAACPDLEETRGCQGQDEVEVEGGVDACEECERQKKETEKNADQEEVKPAAKDAEKGKKKKEKKDEVAEEEAAPVLMVEDYVVVSDFTKEGKQYE